MYGYFPVAGSSAISTCIEGYYPNKTTRFCNMTWNGTEPTCTQTTCSPDIVLANGSYVPENTTYHYGDTIEFSCQHGFDLLGPNSVACLTTGMWSNSLPVCLIKDCGNLIDPINGAVLHIDGTTFGQTAHYNCSEGYTLNGTDTRICNASGIWTLEAPSCDVIRKLFIDYVYGTFILPFFNK